LDGAGVAPAPDQGSVDGSRGSSVCGGVRAEARGPSTKAALEPAEGGREHDDATRAQRRISHLPLFTPPNVGAPLSCSDHLVGKAAPCTPPVAQCFKAPAARTKRWAKWNYTALDVMLTGEAAAYPPPAAQNEASNTGEGGNGCPAFGCLIDALKTKAAEQRVFATAILINDDRYLTISLVNQNADHFGKPKKETMKLINAPDSEPEVLLDAHNDSDSPDTSAIEIETTAVAVIDAPMPVDIIIVKLDAARIAISECRSALDAKRITDVAQVLRMYAERTKASTATVNLAAEVQTLAERQLGAFLIQTPKHRGGNPNLTGSRAAPVEPTLTSLGITKKQSARAQRLAAVPEDVFSERVEVINATGERLSPTKVLSLGKRSSAPGRARGMAVARRVVKQLKDIDPADAERSQGIRFVRNYCNGEPDL
jgi:hypothetical protein